MKIDHVKEAVRVGMITLHPKHLKKLKLVPDLDLPKKQLKQETGRVYLLTVDGTIVKIGGSQSKGGIKSTIDAYLNGFARGMSLRTYCVWNFMRKAVEQGNIVEFHVVFAPIVRVDVPKMNGSVHIDVPVDFHIIERLFVEEYLEIEKTYPYLNVQESGRKWSDLSDLTQGYHGVVL